MEVLRIILTSWPLAFMFAAFLLACIALYVINWFKRSDTEDKALRASQATIVVAKREDY